MGRSLLAAAACLASLALGTGCLSAQKYLNYPFLGVRYSKHGVKVEDVRHRFEYDALQNTERIEVGRDLTLIDNECDGRVDVVKFKDDEFRRGESGTEELFRRADGRWKTVREYLLAAWFRSRRSGMLRKRPELIVDELD